MRRPSLIELIASGEMPVTIGVFITPGRVPATSENALDRFNRSYEYDGLGDNYARFLLEELLPDVETKKTADGRAIRLSKNGNDRAIGGSSSGAICAFTAAWERPQEFSRVFSAIGTYVGLRGGNDYPTLIRKVEPKPLRVFLEDGSNDLNIYGGDWWMANQTMERALTFAGYEVNHDWGDGGHNGKHATEIFPEAMRWLWKDWPRSHQSRSGLAHSSRRLVAPDADWQLVAEGYRFTEGPATNAAGEVFFNDVPNSKTYKIGLDGTVTLWVEDSKRGNGQAFAPDGRLIAVAAGAEQILSYDERAKPPSSPRASRETTWSSPTTAAPTSRPQAARGTATSQVWYIAPDGDKNRSRQRPPLLQRHRPLPRPVPPLRRRHAHQVGLQLPDPARWLARSQAKVLPPPRPRHRRRQRRRRYDHRPRRPPLRRHPHGNPNLRPGRPRQRHPPHPQRPRLQPLLRRPELRHHLRHLRR